MDVRGVSAGLPAEGGWTPPVPAGTTAPTRGWGADVGAHVYVLRFRGGAVGVGATWLTARGSAAPEAAPGTTAPASGPALRTRVTAMAPQISINFGHMLGWSYLSAGLGRTRVRSEVTGPGVLPAALEAEGVKTLNFGGGARWFLNDHLGVGFDVRWHKLSLVPASGTHPGAPRASLLVAGAGIVLK